MIVFIVIGSGIIHQDSQPKPVVHIANLSRAYVNRALPTLVGNNTPPTAINQSIITNQNTTVDITLTGSDPDLNDTLKIVSITNSSHGTLSKVNQDTGIVTYTPKSGFTGIDSFTSKSK